MVQAGMVMLWELLMQRLTKHVLWAGSWTGRQTRPKEISSPHCGCDKEEKSKTDPFCHWVNQGDSKASFHAWNLSPKGN